jgi:ABC-type amino acid transport substrate-binding protein
MRVSIFVLLNVAVRDGAGDLHGVAVDLSRQLGKELGVPVLVTAASTPTVAVRSGDADLTFLVNLPERVAVIDFTPSYVDLEVSILSRQAPIFTPWPMSTALRIASSRSRKD